MKIINWQYSMSTHQFYMWKAFQELTGSEILFFLEKPADFQTKMVSLDDLRNVGEVVFSSGSRWKFIISMLKKNPQAVHVFGGFRNSWYFIPSILYALSHDIKCAVMNEPYAVSPVGYFREESGGLSRLKVEARPLFYRALAFLLRMAEKHTPLCALPLSLLASRQFEKAGFPSQTIYPFGYFVPRQPLEISAFQPEGTGFRMIFVGSLLTTKGLDIASEAVEKLNQNGLEVSLDVYGPGSPEPFIRQPSACVHYKGALDPKQVQPVISRYDILILPSRHDGWGVVVNEALLQGVPVIVSDHVGAKCLIESNGAGVVFQSENVEDLVRKLERIIHQPACLDEMRRNALLAGDSISTEASAKYLQDVFQYHFFQKGQRPSALWTGGL
jgi:glycosyltransferase involved in cell wall biosynthesis